MCHKTYNGLLCFKTITETEPDMESKILYYTHFVEGQKLQKKNISSLQFFQKAVKSVLIKKCFNMLHGTYLVKVMRLYSLGAEIR